MFRLYKFARFIRNNVMFLSFFFSPGVIVGIILLEVMYWTSPEWAQKIGLPTEEGHRNKAIADCSKLLASICKTEVVHDGGLPISSEGLPLWTLIRVERRFESGLTIVSLLGPHENFQCVVRDLRFSEGTIFRVLNGTIINIPQERRKI